MEEKEPPPPPQIFVIDASIAFTDGTVFHASHSLLHALNKRIKKENRIPILQLEGDGDIFITWVEN